MSTDESECERVVEHILADASTLWERLDGSYTPRAGVRSTQLASARLEKWLERAAQGDPVLFNQRLAWLETTPEKVSGLLGDVRLRGARPGWSQVFSAATESRAEACERKRASNHPFGIMLAPFVRAGIARLVPTCHSLFSEEIFSNLADDLLRQLSNIAGPTLYLEFSTYRAAHGFEVDGPSQETRLYKAFSAHLLEDGWLDFFSQYPVLARLLSVITGSWAQNVNELALALEDDLPDIRRLFCGEGSPGALSALFPSLSDRHDGGRTVALLEFENGLKLLYKPRDIGIERAWFSLLTFLNERGGDFHILKVLDRDGHGWVEAAAHAPCRDRSEAEMFYVRAGMLLAVLYLTEASDCFYENVVASGSYPVLIDMETLMHRVFRRSRERGAAAPADDLIFGSVLRTGFLPLWEVSPDGISVDISGLGARAGRLTPYRERRWLNVNTDAMRLEHQSIKVCAEEHLPRLDGAALNAAEYTAEIVSGFRQMYELLLKLRAELSADDGPLDKLGRQEVRIVFHATRLYGLLQKRLSAPRQMRNGVERSIETDVLSRFYLNSAEKSELWPILEAEIYSMERLDIPRFAAPADDSSLRLPTGRTIEDAFEETALERMRRKLFLLSQDDLEMQTEFIRASLRISDRGVVQATPEVNGKIRERSATVSPAFGETVPLSSGEITPLSSDEFVREAAAIAALIEERTIISADGSANWVAPQLTGQSSHQELRPLRMDLYGGLAGIAIFHAALESITGTGRRTALAALSPLLRFIERADAQQMLSEGYTLGAATGVGSFIYALCRCALLLQDSALLLTARAAAERITPEWIAADVELDVTAGAAGAILGLVALYDATGDASALEKAVLCGDHLIGKREMREEGAAWRSVNGRFMTGMAHGAAGIALALLRLFKASGEGRFRSVAEDAVMYEDSVFDEVEANWPDFRYQAEGRPGFMNTWCHGGPGIGLARLSSLSIQDGARIRRDIEAALRVVERSGIGEQDGLCCGNLGRAELLLSAASMMRADGEFERRAVGLVSVVVERSRRLGGYRLSGRTGQDFFDPSFFQGLSGIGYQLLRMAAPARLPSVLVWE